jgi:hypothetical protein
MAIDRYTKTILTIIALCLIWLSLGGPSLLPAAHAQNGLTEIVVTGWRDSNGVVWRLPASYAPPSGTFVSEDARRRFQQIQTEGLRLPVSTP